MSFEIAGKLLVKYDTQEISASFKKREFVLEVKDTSGSFEFTEYLKFQLTQDRCAILDTLNTGDDLKVYFNLKGRKWEKDGNINYFTNLEAWKIEKTSQAGTRSAGNPDAEAFDDVPMPGEEDLSSPDKEFDDLPF